MRREMAVFGALLLLVPLAGCAGSPQGDSAAATRTVRGTLTKIDPAFVPGSTDAPRAVTIRADDGTDVTVQIGTRVDTNTWNMLHLNSHLLNGEPLSVTYQQVGADAEAVALTE